MLLGSCFATEANLEYVDAGERLDEDADCGMALGINSPQPDGWLGYFIIHAHFGIGAPHIYSVRMVLHITYGVRSSTDNDPA